MSADEMFEKLGTNKIDNCDFCVYEGQVNKFAKILFNKVNKSIIFEGFNTIGIKELQAINKKAEELRLEQRGEIEYDRKFNVP